MGRKRKVHQFGNSFAVVIDKQLCRLLRIDHTTELDMSLDEDRIVIRPIARKDRTGLPDRHQVWKLIQILEHSYGFSAEHYMAVRTDRIPWAMFKQVVGVNGYVSPTTIARMAHCLERRRELQRIGANEPWSTTIEKVVAAVPSKTAQETSPSDAA